MSTMKIAGAALALAFIPLLAAGAADNGAGNDKVQSVSVVNTPTVNVRTLPAVTLSGNPTVNIGGSQQPLAVKNVHEPAISPAQESLRGQIAAGSFEVVFDFVVPAGKRFVIESVNARVFGANEAFMAFITTTTTQMSTGTPVTAQHPLNVILQPVPNNLVFVTSESLKLYADPGTHVSVTIQRTGLFQTIDPVDGSLVGYLVNLQ